MATQIFAAGAVKTATVGGISISPANLPTIASVVLTVSVCTGIDANGLPTGVVAGSTGSYTFTTVATTAPVTLTMPSGAQAGAQYIIVSVLTVNGTKIASMQDSNPIVIPSGGIGGITWS